MPVLRIGHLSVKQREVLCLGLVLAGCGSSTQSEVPHNAITEQAAESLSASTWRVLRLGRENAPSAHPPPATVKMWSNGRLSGTVSCNGIGGAAMWHSDGSFANLAQPLISTLQECDDTPAARDFAARFWRKMASAQRWSVKSNMMTIQFEDGSQGILTRMEDKSAAH